MDSIGLTAGVARVAIALCLLAGAAIGDDSTDGKLRQLSLEQLGNIEVTTVSKEPVKILRTPAAIYALTQDDIRRSGATSLPEVLRLVPGVTVARIDSNQWSLGVRGFGGRLSRSVLVLIDGRSVYTPLFAGVYWNVQDTLLEDIDRIEVIRGPGGTIWGPNAVNAVINIITRRARDTQGMVLSLGGGNVDQGSAAFRYGGRKGNRFNYRLYGKGFTRGPQFHASQKPFDDWRMAQTGFRMDWEIGDRDTVTLQGDLYKGEAGHRTTLGNFSPPASITVSRNAELSGGNLLGRWQRVLGAGSDLEVQVYYDRTNRRQAHFAEFRDTFDVDLVHHLTLPGRQNFQWGVGARLSAGDAPPVVPTTLFIPNQRTDQIYSLYVQDEIPIVGNQVWLTLGSKFFHNNYTGWEGQPTARLLWTPTPRQTVWAAVTRAVRMPSRTDEDVDLAGLTSLNPLTFIRVKGDGKFVSEYLLGYEAGYRSLIRPTFYVDLAAFYNSYDHLSSVEPGAPIFESSPAPARWVLPYLIRNGLVGSTYGFEIAPHWTPTGWWRLAGSYSFLRLDLKRKPDSVDPSSVNSGEGSSPDHVAVIQSSLDLPRNLEFSQTYRYVSALPAQRVASYGTADVRLAWRPNRSLELSVAGQNLLQPRHPEFGGNPGGLVGIKRSVFATLTWRAE